MLNSLHGSADPQAQFFTAAPAAVSAAPAAQTSMKKVVLIVGIAIAIFIAFTAYSVRKDIRGAAQLATIKDLYFPVLQRLDADIVRIDKLEATYIEVAVTGDRDLFDKATDVYKEADSAYGEVAGLDADAAASAAHQKEEWDIIAKILRISIGKFNDFVHSAQGYLAANRKLLGETGQRDPEVIAALFRNMHTVKGNARTFEFTHITNAAHRAEQNYDRFRKDEQAVWNANELLAELDAVDAALAQYVTINEDKLGRKGRASDLLTTRGVFVGNDALAELRQMAEKLAQPLTREQADSMRRAIDNLGLIPLKRIVSGSVDSLSSLAHELHKPTPAAELMNDDDLAFNSGFAEALKGSLMHIVRNSLDHGIEMPDERTRMGKPQQGKLQFVCNRNEGKVQLRIRDDGRGLAPHKLYEKGAAAGVFADGKPTAQAVADIIFMPGLSTSAQVTQVSGRGVGMDALRTFLKEQGASVRIELTGAGTTFDFTPFEFVIGIPQAAYTHA
jgi:chemotaxis protein histidine kinase CheA